MAKSDFFSIAAYKANLEKAIQQEQGDRISQSLAQAAAAQQNVAARKEDHAAKMAEVRSVNLPDNIVEAVYKKAEERAQEALADFDENKEIDWTKANERKQYDAEREQLVAEVNRAQSGLDKIDHRKKLKSIDELNEEDRANLENFVKSRAEQQSVLGQSNVIRWMQNNKVRDESWKALVDKFGEEKAKEMAETYGIRMADEEAGRVQKQAKDSVNKNWISAAVANIAGVPARALGNVEAAAGRLFEQANRTGQYRTLQANTPGDMLSIYGNAVTNQTAKNIAGENGGLVREAASIGYQALTGAADNVARLFLGGGGTGSLALAAMGSFSQTLSEASKQGATPQQAAVLATGKAGLEVLTEKMALDDLLGVAGKDLKGAEAIARRLLTSAFTNITEEEISLLGGMLFEAAVLRERSDYKTKIAEMVARGIPYEQAKEAANRNIWNEVLNTAAVSGLTGAAMAGGKMLADKATVSKEQMLANALGEVTGQKPAQIDKPVQAEYDNTNNIFRGAENDGREDGKNQDWKYDQNRSGISSAEMGAEPGAGSEQTGIQGSEQRGSGKVLQSGNRSVTDDFDDEFDHYDGKPAADVEGRDIPIESAEKLYGTTVIDTNGAPLPVYHGTPEMNFTVFQKGDSGFHFGTMEQAKNRIKSKNRENGIKSQKGRVFRVYLDIKKPVYVENDIGTWEAPAVAMLMEHYGILTTEEANAVKELQNQGSGYDAPAAIKLREILSPKGYDGIVYPNLIEGEGKSYLVFNDNQIVRSEIQNIDENGASTVDTQKPSPEGGHGNDTAVSRTYSNSGLHNANPNVRQGYREQMKEDPDSAKYTVKHNADTMTAAKERVATPEKVNAAYDDLMAKDHWNAEDVATSTLLLDRIMASGEADSREKLDAMRVKRKEMGSGMGQAVQAFAIQEGTMQAAESPATAVDSFNKSLNSMKEGETTYNAKKAGVSFEQWKKDIQRNVDNIGIAIACVEDGDKNGMLDIIRQIARNRKTTAWFGSSDKLTGAAERALRKLDFDTLKTIANTQIAAMADDYRKRTAADVTMAARKQAMLSSIRTALRNLSGNSTVGLIDSVSDSGTGRLADALMAKFTGMRTVGDETKHSKEYLNAAKDAASFASLCLELNIPIETDAASSFASAQGKDRGGKYIGKTFRANGNAAMRTLYATQKYLAYALEVTDKIFEGGTNASVQASLENLKNSGLTEEQAADVADFTARRRTYKNATWEDSDGNTRGSQIARATADLKNWSGKHFGKGGEMAADVVLPFVDVAMNVAQTGIDYTAGMVKGTGEILSIIKDAKDGKTIDPKRQRAAASDFARGVTGVGMIALATALSAKGIIKVSQDEDKDKKALDQSQGLANAQMNLSAMYRAMSGGSAEWNKDDIIVGMDFLEPLNTQLYLGHELAQEDNLLDMLKAYPGATVKSVYRSLMDSPLMDGLTGLVDTIQDVDAAVEEGDMVGAANAFAGYGGDVATSFIPQYVRQTAQYIDPVYRDTSGDTPMEAAANRVKAAIPGASKTLPAKISGLGEEQRRGGFMSTFVDPFGFSRYQPNEVARKLDELAEATGDKGIYPDSAAPKKIRVNGEDVLISGKEMTETYQQTYGDNVSAMYSGLMDSEAFRQMPAQMQAEALKKAEEYATEKAKAAVSDYDGAPEEDASALVSQILDNGVKNSITDAIENGSVEGLGQALSVYNALPVNQRNELLKNGGGRVGHFLAANNAGVDAQTFLNLYGQYKAIDDTDKEIGEKSDEWKYVLTKAKEAGTITNAQKNVMMNNMQYWVTFPGGSDNFENITSKNVKADKAKMIIEAANSIIPPKGKEKPTQEQYAKKFAGMVLSDHEKAVAMKEYLNDAQDKNLDDIMSRGYSPKDYARLYELYSSESGSGKKWRTIAAIQKAYPKMEYGEAKALYEIFQNP